MRRGSFRIDWQRVCSNLRAAGLALDKASLACGRDKSWLSHIDRGEVSRVEFHDGLRLLDLHLDTCGMDVHRTVIIRK